MAGELVKTEAICLDIRPWSRTSHVVTWLTPDGRLATLVKGAVRPKSAFLGQYDLNYTCEIVYYGRARGDIHILRECTPLDGRPTLRADYRSLALAGYFRRLASELAPSGPEAADWYGLLEAALTDVSPSVAALLDFELKTLHLLGLAPEVEADAGSFQLRGERRIPVSPSVARAIRTPWRIADETILLDAARAIGVFYAFHVDCAPEVRRTVLGMIATRKQES